MSFFATKADIENDHVRGRSNDPPRNSSFLDIGPCQQHKEEHHQDHYEPHQDGLAILEKSGRLAGKVFTQEENQLHDVPHNGLGFRGLLGVGGALEGGVLKSPAPIITGSDVRVPSLRKLPLSSQALKPVKPTP